MGKTMFGGPWYGEKGLYPFWLAGCRYAARHGDYDRVIVCAEPGLEALSADFAEFQPHPWTGITACGAAAKNGTGPSRSDVLAQIPDGAEVYEPCETHWFDDRDHPGRQHPGNRFTEPVGDKQEFIRYGTARDEWRGAIVVHARWRQEWGSERNWGAANWDALAAALFAADPSTRLICVGSPASALAVTGAVDMRGIPVAGLLDLFASAAVVIGESSGPMHWAALCGAPLVTWVGYEGIKREILVDRYLTDWNPHNVPVACIEAADWQPSPDAVAAQVGGLLEYLREQETPGDSIAGPAAAVGASPSPSAAASLLTPPVGIGVICYHGLGDVERCLRAVEAHTPEPHDLIVLDNSEADMLVREYVAAHYPLATYIRPSTQYGCWRGRNLIWKHCEMQGYGSFVVIDSDVVVTAGDWLARMLAHMNTDPAIGVVGWSTANILGRELGPNGEVVELPGMCQLHRTAAVADVNGWCRGYYPFHSGDTDFCLRLQKVGAHPELASREWKCCVAPGEPAILHEHPHSGVYLCPDHDGVVERSMQLLADRTRELGLPVMENIRHLMA